MFSCSEFKEPALFQGQQSYSRHPRTHGLWSGCGTVVNTVNRQLLQRRRLFIRIHAILAAIQSHTTNTKQQLVLNNIGATECEKTATQSLPLKSMPSGLSGSRILIFLAGTRPVETGSTKRHWQAKLGVNMRCLKNSHAKLKPPTSYEPDPEQCFQPSGGLSLRINFCNWAIAVGFEGGALAKQA